MATPRLGLDDKYLELMRRGVKPWEGRLHDGKCGGIRAGDHIVFESGTQTLHVVVEERRTYASFAAMLQDEGVEAFLPGEGKDLEGAVRVYRAFPGYEEGEAGMGAVAFKIGLREDGPSSP